MPIRLVIKAAWLISLRQDEGYKTPLVYEPGEGWAYGPGLDWAGRLVRRTHSIISDKLIRLLGRTIE